jgi:hypothetical protein
LTSLTGPANEARILTDAVPTAAVAVFGVAIITELTGIELAVPAGNG